MSTTTKDAPGQASPPAALTISLGLSTRTQILCAWGGLALIVLVVGGWLVMTGFIPPPTSPPTRSPSTTATIRT